MIPRCPLCSHQHWPGMPHLMHDSELEQIVAQVVEAKPEPKPTAKDQRKARSDASRQAAGERMRKYWADKRAVDQRNAKAMADAGQDEG